jgi:hypothetical protein
VQQGPTCMVRVATAPHQLSRHPAGATTRLAACDHGKGHAELSGLILSKLHSLPSAATRKAHARQAGCNGLTESLSEPVQHVTVGALLAGLGTQPMLMQKVNPTERSRSGRSHSQAELCCLACWQALDPSPVLCD